MNKNHKIVSAMSFILGLSVLFFSLYTLSSALAYNTQQSFAPPSLTYDESEYRATNLKIPLLIVFTVFFGLGSCCENFSERLRLSKNRKAAYLVFCVPFSIQFLFLLVGMVWFPFGFMCSALAACGFVILSGLFLRFSMMDQERFAKVFEHYR